MKPNSTLLDLPQSMLKRRDHRVIIHFVRLHVLGTSMIPLEPSPLPGPQSHSWLLAEGSHQPFVWAFCFESSPAPS